MTFIFFTAYNLPKIKRINFSQQLGIIFHHSSAFLGIYLGVFGGVLVGIYYPNGGKGSVIL